MIRLETGKGSIGSLEGDRQVLAQLRKAGADLTKTTEVNFYLYFQDRAAAESAAVHAGEGPLVATVRQAADDSTWLCFVSGQMVPAEALIHAHAARLLSLATAHGGEYDGWEAAIVE
jgi:regulator of RNase E activity RraB